MFIIIIIFYYYLTFTQLYRLSIYRRYVGTCERTAKQINCFRCVQFLIQVYLRVYDIKNNRSFTASLYWAFENVQHCTFCYKKLLDCVYRISIIILCKHVLNNKMYKHIKHGKRKLIIDLCLIETVKNCNCCLFLCRTTNSTNTVF